MELNKRIYFKYSQSSKRCVNTVQGGLMRSQERVQVAIQVSKVSICLNVCLAFIKITLGFVSSSPALVADGWHSVSDLVTTGMAMVGVAIAERKEDDNHQYGHEKFEPVVGKLMALFLFITGLVIIYRSGVYLQSGQTSIPGRLALLGAGLSIFSKEGLYRYTLKQAERIQSTVLKADAWHHRTDALSSVGAFLGILGAINGIPIMEPLATIGIGVLIIKVAVDIYLQSIKELTDVAADAQTIENIRSVILETEGVLSIDDLKTRIHVSKLYVDVEIGVYAELPLRQAHIVAEMVHHRIEKLIPSVKHCMVHVNPCETDGFI